jgi:hypothetical protein
MVTVISPTIATTKARVREDLSSLNLIGEPFLIHLGPEITEFSLHFREFLRIGIRTIEIPL